MNVTAFHSEYIAPDPTDRSKSLSNNGSLLAVAEAQVQLEQEHANGVQLLARLRRLVRKKAGRRLSALSACRAILQGTHPDREIRDFFENLPSADKHYWIATYYALLMPPKKRLKLAAYFTPPQLAKYAIEKLRELGIHPGTSRILDPSSGGAAFLVPLAQVIALDARKKQLDPRATLDKISAITTRMIADPLKN